MNIKIELNEPNIIRKVTNDRFGLLTANEWKRLIDPYTPRATGMLEETTAFRPFLIHYKMNYAEYVYYGHDKNFRKKNPYSTYEWDLAAEKAGQKDKLYRTLNNALQSGRY